MKKRKFSIILNISALCLCLAAIAIGVYSVKTAQLNITGTIGFEAHNCDVMVNGIIENGSRYDSTTKQLTPTTLYYNTTGAAESTPTYKNVHNDKTGWQIGDLYFDDLNDVPDDKIANDIVITLKMYNKATYPVYAVFNGDKLGIDESKITIAASESYLRMAENQTETESITFTITFTLESEEFTRLNLISSNPLVIFTREVPIKKSSLTIKKAGEITDSSIVDKDFVNTFPYYIEYGSQYVNASDTTKTPIAWHIIGTADENDQIVALTDSDKTQLAAGKLDDNKKYIFISRHTLNTSTTKGGKNGLCFQSDWYEGSDTGTYVTKVSNSSGEQFDVLANDYANSNIRKYLNNENSYIDSSSDYGATYTKKDGTILSNGTLHSAKQNTKTNIFSEFYSLNNIIYDMIHSRSLKSLYTKMSSINSVDTVFINVDKPENISSNEFSSISDKFWLLSYYEEYTILDNTTRGASTKRVATFANSLTEVPIKAWTRSPLKSYAASGVRICEDGTIGYDDMLHYVSLIRPSFIL